MLYNIQFTVHTVLLCTNAKTNVGVMNSVTDVHFHI